MDASSVSDRPVMLVCIGAGASHDALVAGAYNQTSLDIDGLPSVLPGWAVPPLTKDLVGIGPLTNWHIGRHGRCKPVVDWLRRRTSRRDATESFEDLLVEYRDKRAGPHIGAHLASLRFYVRDLLWSCTEFTRHAGPSGAITNYASLVNDLHHWADRHDRDVCFVTFNYDLLLEDACKDEWGMNCQSRRSYLDSDPRLTVLKPHGSIHWEHAVPRHPTSSVEAERIVVEEFGMGTVDPRFDVVSEPPWRREHLLVQPALPALALPMADKTQLEWPPEQQEFMLGLKGRVSSVVALGWRAAEAHFTGLLHAAMRPDCPVVVVNPDEQEGGRIGARIRPRASGSAAMPLVLRARFSGLHADERWRNFLDGAAVRGAA